VIRHLSEEYIKLWEKLYSDDMLDDDNRHWELRYVVATEMGSVTNRWKGRCFVHHWQKLHSHAYTCVMVCSFVSFTYYLIYLRRWIAKKIHLWSCLLHCSFPSYSW
jgi:hypothetical protein